MWGAVAYNMCGSISLTFELDPTQYFIANNAILINWNEKMSPLGFLSADINNVGHYQ